MSPSDATNLAKGFLTDLVQQGWSEGEPHRVLSRTSEDFRSLNQLPGSQLHGTAGVAEMIGAFRLAFPDLRTQMMLLIGEAGKAVAFWYMEGTHGGPLLDMPPSRQCARFYGVAKASVSDGQVQELAQYVELGQLADQIAPDRVSDAMRYDVKAPNGPLPIVPSATADPNVTREAGRRHLEDVWNGSGDYSLLRSLLVDDFRDHNLVPGQGPGAEGYVASSAAIMGGFNDWQVDLHDLIVEGDLVADHWTINGTQTADTLGMSAQGRRMNISGMDILRVNPEGLLTDIWHIEDIYRFRQQLVGAV